jgi:diphosphomevalonate decarboxylase
MAGEIPVLGELTIAVSTENSFPHSTGIASSASGLSAFTLCLLDLAKTITGEAVPQNSFMQDASYAARLGSGSACRSVYGGFALWGQTELIKGSSDEFAVPVQAEIHPEMLLLRDAILVISTIGKSLPSTAGHKTMEEHPFLGARIVQAGKNLAELLNALSTNNFEKLCTVAESEALTLHALVMSANPGVLLMKPATVEAIQRVRAARQAGLPVFFTLDAGASVHVMYPGSSAEQVESFIREALEPLCEAGRVIYDRCGAGPVKLNQSLPAL